MSYDIWLEADLGGEERARVGDLDWNYTSNCAPMWGKAMPDTKGLREFHGMKAGDALVHLERGIAAMEAAPDEYRELNPPNGWGDFDSQLAALKELAVAFREAPAAYVAIWR